MKTHPEPECLLVARSLASTQPIIDAIPFEASELLHRAMMTRGATADEAFTAVASIKRAFADWVFSGGHTYHPSDHQPEAAQKAELQMLAKAASALMRAISDLSIDANVRLNHSLLGEQVGPWSGLLSMNWNPDPIEVDQTGGGLLSAARRRRGETTPKLVLPANLSAKLDRFIRDLNELEPAIERSSRFVPRKTGNEPIRHLFRQAIHAWARATEEWPTAGLKGAHDDDPDGQKALPRKGTSRRKSSSEGSRAASPIPGALKDMAIAVLLEVPAALNDAAFLRVLRVESKTAVLRTGRRGIFGRTPIPVSRPPRGRPRKSKRVSSGDS